MGKFKEKITAAFNHLGLFYNEPTNIISLDYESYQVKGPENKLREHRDFLTRLQENEERRLESIDSKTSQLISQTGIIFSLLGLFIPVLMDKATEFDFMIKAVLILCLVAASFFYILTINNALKNYRISKFNYQRAGANNVLEMKDKSIEEFISEEIRDILSCIKINISNNNRKGTNILHSYAAFKIANLFTGVLIVLVGFFMLFNSPGKEITTIDGKIELKDFGHLIDRLDTSAARRDTIILNLKDTSTNKKIPTK